MRILIPGGTGQIGTILARHLTDAGHTVTLLSRSSAKGDAAAQRWTVLGWDAKTPGPWVEELSRTDAVINLCGRSVNCRYNAENRRLMIESRSVTARLIGEAIAASPTPPPIWMNASTSTFYRDTRDQPNDEFTGILGDLPGHRGEHEAADLPETWSFSISVAHAWEEAVAAVNTPNTRKIRLRSSMTMSPDKHGVFDVLSSLVRTGLGGTQGSGTQFVSWIHAHDYCRATDLLLAQPEITDETDGVINLTAPEPLPNRDFMRLLRGAWHKGFGLPATKPMLEIGALFMRTETELILKSRRVVPALLEKHGFRFDFPTWREAAADLVARSKA